MTDFQLGHVHSPAECLLKSLCPSSYPYARNNSRMDNLILIKFDTGKFRKIVMPFQFSFTLHNFHDHFTLEHKYFSELISIQLRTTFTLVIMVSLVTIVTEGRFSVMTSSLSEASHPHKGH
jgi:hypothetical protein